MLFPALRKMSLALTVLPLTVRSSLAMTAAVFPAVIRLPLVSSVMVSAWSFHPVLPRLIFYGIVLVNSFVCFLIFLYFSGIHSFLHGIQGFQPAVSHFSGSPYRSGYGSYLR